MTILHTMGMLSLAAAGLVVACDRSDDQKYTSRGTPTASSSTAGVTNMQPTVNTTVVDRMASARCARELRCNNVGAGHTYATTGVCVDQMRGSLGNELNTYACPRGIDLDQVNRCLAAIENEQCDHPLDTLQRFDKCASSTLCAK